MKKKEKLPPSILFIFGGSGDLANRKLIPALYNLFLDGHLPEKFNVIGVGRTSFPDINEYRGKLLEGIRDFSRRKENLEEKWLSFAPLISYHEMDLTDDESYRRMKDRKSTRLNSSHVKISYAVFCLKKTIAATT